MCDVCSNRAGVYLAAQNLNEECATLSPIVPVEPLQPSSPPVPARSNCSLAALHDETQLPGRQWVSLFSPLVEDPSSNGIEHISGADNGDAAADDCLGALFNDPGSDSDDSYASRRPNQTPLFDPACSLSESAQPDASAVIDLTMSSSPPEVVSLKKEPPSSAIASTAKKASALPRAALHRPVPSILQTLDVNGQPLPQPRAESSRRLQTIDQLADEGVSGAVIIGEPRSPGHAKRKQREREKTFKDVAPLSGSDGPYSFYNSAAPRKKSRVEKLQFRTPGPAPIERDRQSSPLVAVTTGMRESLYSTPPAASPAPEPVTDRKSGMARLLTAATASFEKGDLAEEIFVAWKRKETGEQR